RPLYCPYPLSVSIPAMVIPHLLLLGAVEAFFTAAAYSYVKKVSPGMIYAGGKQKIKAVYGLLAALILLSPLGLLAAGTAWGEWDGAEIKSMLGYIPEGIGKGFSLKAMMPDYSVPGLSGAAGYILSAAAGAAILVIIFKLLGLILKKNAVKADD
ncbi:MAG: PDGLE domain-containing protein, partial [Bacillota bacterium]|nr:PDGLE domain-containing protein [Bacillota bacterium]